MTQTLGKGCLPVSFVDDSEDSVASELNSRWDFLSLYFIQFIQLLHVSHMHGILGK